MPWKKKDGTTIKAGQGWTDDNNIVHPSNWMIWSDTYKKSVGLTWEDPPASEAPFDNRFYWGRKKDGSLIERSLTDIKGVDSDGKAILDEDGNQVVTKGLKTIWTEKTKQDTNTILSKTDWMITRKTEKGTAIPDATTKYRDSVRTACNTIETKINDCSSLADFIKLFNAPVDSDGKPTGDNPPIYDFPKENKV
jgi:hypothetical protein